MEKMILLFLAVSLALLLLTTVPAKAAAPLPLPVIEEIVVRSPTVEQYGKFEARVSLRAVFTNPYDYDQIAVSATFTSPSGAQKIVDGFFMQDYSLNTSTGNLAPSGSGEFRLRFSPDETGAWSFVVSVTDANGRAVSEAQSFLCTGIFTPANHGFLRTGSSNYLEFDDGAPYVAIGHNIAWPNHNTYFDYKAWLDGLFGNGGNFFRLWHAHWGLGIEWSSGNGFQGLRHYKQSNCYYQDWLFDLCAERGIYIMLALQHHGQVSTQVNPNWNESPYNVANGGPCQNTIDFFRNEEARAHTKNQYRYILARWGYARSILCWELFNEVHWTDNFQANKDIVAQWHFEMADYLKSLDPNGHLISTSYGDDTTDENVWSHPDFSLTQTHIYNNTPNIERVLASANRSFLEEFGKPTLNSEFGLGGSAGLAQQDPGGIHLHNSLWGGLFSGAFGTAMSWWWDTYIHPQNLYYHFDGLSQVAAEVPFRDAKLAPARAYVEGAPGSLSLTPSLGWAGIGDPEITIDENGLVSPAGARLGQFLYGSEWNTQYRSPPTFRVHYPAAGEFTVTTGDETSTGPVISIWLDGSLLLQQNATPNSEYTITVPAGTHAIRVDNTGTDWITIASYSFEGLGSQVDAYVLVGEGQQLAAGWALNHRYNHRQLVEHGEPESAPPSFIEVEGFQDGAYAVRWYEPLTGIVYGGASATASGGKLSIPLPSFVWDVAFVVDNSPVASREALRNLKFELYPNPARPGMEVSVGSSGPGGLSGRAALLDATGREAYGFQLSDGRFQLPERLSGGMYWLRVESEKKIGVRALVLVE